MDFFQAQRDARKRTRWLYAFYALGVVCMGCAVYSVGAVVAWWHSLRSADMYAREFPFSWQAFWDPTLFAFLFGGTLALIALACVYKITQLSHGAFTVATNMGARRVEPNTSNREERRLLNVVEEMAIASGIPVPDVYVLDNEPGINAFAAGFSPSDSLICATQGTLKILKRDELQGVVGHEFSHLLNGDSAINVRAIGLLFGILVIRLIGEGLFRTARVFGVRSRRDNSGAVFAIVGLFLIIIGSVGAFFARVLQAAISRQRETLADASAVQFTRDINGLASALKKIGGYVRGSNIYTPKAIEARHMFFSDAAWSKFLDFGIFRTHPPIEERIRALEPNWNGEFPKTDFDQVAEEIPSPFALKTPSGRPLQTGAALMAMHQALQQIGAPTDKEVELAQRICARLPAECLQAAHDPALAPILILSLLLSKDEGVAAAQCKIITDAYGAQALQEMESFSSLLRDAPSMVRLSLINIATPVLRHLSEEEYKRFSSGIDALIRSDQKISLFEYALRHTLTRHLHRYRKNIRPAPIAFRKPSDIADSAAIILSALAWFGSDYDEPTSQEAFREGAEVFDLRGAQLAMKNREECNLHGIDAALKRYDRATEMLKKNLLFAAAKIVSHDGKLSDREAELLRAVGDALDCPIPPIQV